MAVPARDADTLKRIRAAGLRATRSRVAVLNALAGATRPVTHSELLDLLDVDIPWDRATLYRNLADLTAAGLLRRLDLGDHVWRFEFPEAASHPDVHPHFVCTDCGEVQCLDSVQIAVDAHATVPRSVRRAAVEIQLNGVCDTCDLPAAPAG